MSRPPEPAPQAPQPLGGAILNWVAPFWFQDALDEARLGESEEFGGRVPFLRREILFAVCCAESYLVEWVQLGRFLRSAAEIGEYFPANDRRPLPQRWKEVTKELRTRGKLKVLPEFGGERWAEFLRLQRYRHGLVHGNASRFESATDTAESLLAFPSHAQLMELEPGWPTMVVTQQILSLHTAAGTAPPSWIPDAIIEWARRGG